MLPISASILICRAASMVMARSASGTPIRSSGPSTWPDAVTRLTAHHAVCRWPSGVIGESEWIEKLTPLAKAVPQASIRAARSGPTVTSRCWSPQ